MKIIKEMAKVAPYSNHLAKPLNDLYRIIGEFGRFHWILETMFVFMFIVPFSSYVHYGLHSSPERDWKCVEGSRVCCFNGTQPNSNDFRCNIPRSFSFSRLFCFLLDTFFLLFFNFWIPWKCRLNFSLNSFQKILL